MILLVLRGNRINRLVLPDNCDGDHIIKDYKGNVLGNLYADQGKWLFNASHGYVVEGGDESTDFVVDLKQEVVIRDTLKDSKIYLYMYFTNIEGIIQKRLKTTSFTIGQNGTISYQSPLIKATHAKVNQINGIWYIESVEGSSVYVNDRLIRRKRLEHGDTVFIYGLKFSIISDFIIVESVNKSYEVLLQDSAFEEFTLLPQEVRGDALEDEGEFETYSDEDQFLRSPRFRSKVEHQDVKITPPPTEVKENTKPGILTVGPRLTMILTSGITMMTTLNNIATGQATFESSMPSLILGIVSLISSFLWPALSKRWQTHEKKKQELKRVKLYRKYLEKKEQEIIEAISLQRQVILENNMTLEDCQLVIYNKRRNLWEKTIDDDDFLTVRLGTGKIKPDLDISWNEEDFSMTDDYLREELKDMLKKYEYMENMPLNLSLIENKVTAVIGNYSLLYRFMQSIMLQIVTFHLYSELKICVFTDEDKVADWNYLKFLPHCWDNPHTKRFIAATPEEKNQLSSHLESVFHERGGAEEEDSYKDFDSYYLIIVDNIDTSRNYGIIDDVLKMKGNCGFSLLIKNDRIANLPRQCNTFINITEDVSGVFQTDLTNENQKQFKADFNTTINVEDCIQQLSNIFVEVPKEKYELPKSIGFLEMYEVGNVEQLNSIMRWRGNNPIVSLAVPVGIDQGGNRFYMDIHEKAFGPHGLVAGTTGSGKSEWLITYILSLAVNFSPLEMQFVLIDYKGGGLAGSFENPETGMELPHLVGTITNLDKSEIRRSLASLQSESKRRQRMFNEARDKLDDSSMDIYKYQQYFRKGLVDEPLSHLLIISDEFAELKSQEPEFLDSLVSIARVGRSLGIHLILATQKPSGVVTDQIWSNSRFKVCLRVQDKADSQDMLKNPDAAYLKQTGSFYLQVGMNEVYALGQSAYAGLKYQPTDMVKKNIDVALEEVGRNGDILNSLEIVEEKSSSTVAEAHGEELLNIIKYLDASADKAHLVARKLWLTAIPGIIYIDNLKKKYPFTRVPYNICPIVGEYDDPEGQQQKAYLLNLNESNVFMAGVSGSGKEMFLQSIIYSCITSYTPQEVNFYICDFGAETLGMFSEAPHVGNVVYSTDDILITNLYKMVKREYAERKKRYREFGGNYESNIKYGTNKDPLMVIIFNGYEFMKDEKADLKEEIEKVMMDSAKYGIVFIVSSVDKNALKSRVVNSFSSIISLHQNDDYDYYEILGSKGRNIGPKDLKGRGLFKTADKVYEFQSASIVPEENLQTQVKTVSTKLNDYYKYKAKAIPVIPNPITIDCIDKEKVSLTSMLVGYSSSTLRQMWINFKNNFSTLITSNKKTNLVTYTNAILYQYDIVKKDIDMFLYDLNDNHKTDVYDTIKRFNRETFLEHYKGLLDKIESNHARYMDSSDKRNFVPDYNCVLFIDAISLMVADMDDELKARSADALVKAEEINMITFIYTDISSELKTVTRDKTVAKLLMSGNGILIDNSCENQMFMDLNTRDIRKRDGMNDNEAYILNKNRALLAEVFREPDEGSDENEV